MIIPSLSRRSLWALGAALAAGALGLTAALRRNSRSGLKVQGASALSPFMSAVARGFQRLHPGEDVEVRSTTDDAAMAALHAGSVDLAMLSRELSPAERGQGLVISPVALDGVAMVVHAENHTLGMPHAQWQELFAGVKRDWQGFGGPNARVTLIARPEGSAARAMVHGYFGITRVMSDAVVFDGDARMIDRLGVLPGGVGYGSMTQIEAAIRAGAALRMLPLGPGATSLESLRAGSYPLRTTLSLVSAASPSSGTRDLLAYAQSAVGQSLLRGAGYISAR